MMVILQWRERNLVLYSISLYDFASLDSRGCAIIEVSHAPSIASQLHCSGAGLRTLAFLQRSSRRQQFNWHDANGQRVFLTESH